MFPFFGLQQKTSKFSGVMYSQYLLAMFTVKVLFSELAPISKPQQHCRSFSMAVMSAIFSKFPSFHLPSRASVQPTIVCFHKKISEPTPQLESHSRDYNVGFFRARIFTVANRESCRYFHPETVWEERVGALMQGNFGGNWKLCLKMVGYLVHSGIFDETFYKMCRTAMKESYFSFSNHVIIVELFPELFFVAQAPFPRPNFSYQVSTCQSKKKVIKA